MQIIALLYDNIYTIYNYPSIMLSTHIRILLNVLKKYVFDVPLYTTHKYLNIICFAYHLILFAKQLSRIASKK